MTLLFDQTHPIPLHAIMAMIVYNKSTNRKTKKVKLLNQQIESKLNTLI